MLHLLVSTMWIMSFLITKTYGQTDTPVDCDGLGIIICQISGCCLAGPTGEDCEDCPTTTGSPMDTTTEAPETTSELATTTAEMTTAAPETTAAMTTTMEATTTTAEPVDPTTTVCICDSSDSSSASDSDSSSRLRRRRLMSSDSDSDSDSSSDDEPCPCPTGSSDSDSDSDSSSDDVDAARSVFAADTIDELLNDDDTQQDEETQIEDGEPQEVDYTMRVGLSDSTLLNLCGIFTLLMVANVLCCWFCVRKRKSGIVELEEDGGSRMDVRVVA